MSPNDKEEHHNPLFASTSGFEAAPGWGVPPTPETEKTTLFLQTPPHVEAPLKKQVPLPSRRRSNQPSTHVMDSEIPYGDRHKKITMMLDKRLLAAFRAYLRDKAYGSSQGARFNHLIFTALSQVYELDPTLLEQDFTYEILMNLPSDE